MNSKQSPQKKGLFVIIKLTYIPALQTKTVDREEFLEFKFYRKNKISLLKRKPFVEFLRIYHDEFSKILDLEQQDLYFAENGAEDHLFNLKKLTNEILEKLRKVISLQNELEENISKLTNITIN